MFSSFDVDVQQQSTGLVSALWSPWTTNTFGDFSASTSTFGQMESAYGTQYQATSPFYNLTNTFDQSTFNQQPTTNWYRVPEPEFIQCEPDLPESILSDNGQEIEFVKIEEE